MKIQPNKVLDISFIAIILFVIFVLVAILNLFFKNLPVVLSVSVLVIAVALVIFLLDEIEGFFVFIGAVVVAVIFVLTFNPELTLTSSAVIIGLIVIFIAVIS